MLPFRLARLGLGLRLGIGALVLVLLGGILASGAHLVGHHEVRDEREGMSYDDVVGHYHGIRTVAPLREALEGGHPEELPADARTKLLEWLGGEQLAETYDSLDLGEDAPVELMDRHCLGCHARGASEGDGVGERLPLEYFDEVEALSVSRDVSPVSEEVLLASLHTHALGMGTLTLLLVLFAAMTRFPPRLVGLLSAAAGLGLFADLGAWWLARGAEGFVLLIVVGGGLWMGASLLLGLLGLAELALPSRDPD